MKHEIRREREKKKKKSTNNNNNFVVQFYNKSKTGKKYVKR